MSINENRMPKIVFTATLTLALLASVFLSALNAAESNATPKASEPAAENSEILKKEVDELHKTIKTLVKDYLEIRKHDKQLMKADPNPKKLTFNLGIGLKQKLGVAAKYSFEENIILNLNGSDIASIEMFYIQTNLRNSQDKKRIVLNENTNTVDFGNIKLEYNDDDGATKNYLVSQLLTVESRSKIIYMYRDYLTRLNRTLEYYITDFKRKEKLSVDQATHLGSD